jgi:hypothetical protein
MRRNQKQSMKVKETIRELRAVSIASPKKEKF